MSEDQLKNQPQSNFLFKIYRNISQDSKAASFSQELVKQDSAASSNQELVKQDSAASSNQELDKMGNENESAQKVQEVQDYKILINIIKDLKETIISLNRRLEAQEVPHSKSKSCTNRLI